MITRPEHSNLLTEEPCPMNHQPLGYEPSRINDTNVFQRLDVAGNDTESLKRHESTVIGPQSDHILGIVQAVEASSADVAG